MRFVFTSAGSFGDLAPLLVLALELRRRGHEIQWVINPFHLETLKKWGFDAIPAGDAATMERAIRDPRLESPLKSFQALSESGKAEAGAFLKVLMETVGADDVLVYRSLMGVARMVEEKKEVPGCAVYLSPTELSSEENRACFLGGHLSDAMIHRSPRWSYKIVHGFIERHGIDRAMWRWINPLRRSLGLAEMRGSYRDWVFGARLPLVLYPEWFGGISGRFPKSMRQTGFAYLPSERIMDLDPVIDAFLGAGEPPVAITQGSAIRSSDSLAEQLVVACRDAGFRTLLLSFDHEGAPGIDGDHCVSSPVAISQVIPRCRALVHRGGVGAVADGLRFGIPQLTVGRTVDQPDNGARITRLGAGRWVYGPTATRRQIRRELDRVLNDPEIRRGAEAAAARCDADGWRSHSADLLENLASDEA